jgi:Flp pilus assembly pilin Flp
MSLGFLVADDGSIVGRSWERSCTAFLKPVFLKPYIWLVGRREEGQTKAEYAVVLGIITLAVVGVFTALAGGISGAIDTVEGVI